MESSLRPQSVSRGAWLALAYLIVAGSIIGFTAYVWLIHHESPTKVGTYAYVNPVVAVLVGYFLGGEAVGPRTIAGTLLVLVSVVVITTTSKKSTETPLVSEAEARKPAKKCGRAEIATRFHWSKTWNRERSQRRLRKAD
jgi:hypothetical protein